MKGLSAWSAGATSYAQKIVMSDSKSGTQSTRIGDLQLCRKSYTLQTIATRYFCFHKFRRCFEGSSTRTRQLLAEFLERDSIFPQSKILPMTLDTLDLAKVDKTRQCNGGGRWLSGVAVCRMTREEAERVVRSQSVRKKRKGELVGFIAFMQELVRWVIAFCRNLFLFRLKCTVTVCVGGMIDSLLCRLKSLAKRIFEDDVDFKTFAGRFLRLCGQNGAHGTVR